MNAIRKQPTIVRNIPKIVLLGDVADASYGATLVALVVGWLCTLSEAMVLEHL
jgi:hypothetical protein